jgi:Tol biopolymer transport system component
MSLARKRAIVTKRGPFLLAVVVSLAMPALGYHRQTPPIVAITGSGDTLLPRVAAGGRRLVVAITSSGKQIFRQDRKHDLLEQITTEGDNDNPSISAGARVLAWDSDCTLLGCGGDPGRQIFIWINGASFQVTHDSTGSSVEPVLSGKGTRIAFQSRANFSGGNTNGTQQVFVGGLDGNFTQASVGKGTSANASLDQSGLRLAFDSTSDLSGNETGVSQIWFLSKLGYPQIVTNGRGPSRNPALSRDGHLIAFESTADLTGDGHDTQRSQIFLYNVAKRTVTQVTHDTSGGCSGPSVSAVPADMSVGYVCNGQGFYYHYGTGHHYMLPINNYGSDTTVAAVAELGGHFMVVSTKANMFGTGTTPGHQIYMLNLFKLATTQLD